MTRKPHRCVHSGRVVRLDARYLPDAREYRTEHYDCAERCIQYHE